MGEPMHSLILSEMGKKPWDPNTSYCELIHEWNVTIPGHEDHHILINDPSMLLCAGLGIATGITGAILISTRKTQNVNVQIMYALTFLTFACMNTSGLTVWCFFPRTRDFSKASETQKWIFTLDGTFSSITSLNFFLCALSDYGILKLRTKMSKQFPIVISVYLIIFAGFYMGAFHNWQEVWKLLYMDVTRYSSSAYFVMTLAKMAVSGDCTGIFQLLAAIVIGISGLDMLGKKNIQRYFCTWMHGWFAGMDIWYIQSDLSLICLLWFYFVTHGAVQKQAVSDKEQLRERLLV